MKPDSGATLPSHTGRTTKRRTNRPAMETATATAHTATNAEIEAAEARIRREKASAEGRCKVIDGDQREGQKTPVHEGVRQAGKRALLDHLALQHDFPQKLADARPQRRHLEIRRGARAADDVQDLCENATRTAPTK